MFVFDVTKRVRLVMPSLPRVRLCCHSEGGLDVKVDVVCVVSVLNGRHVHGASVLQLFADSRCSNGRFISTLGQNLLTSVLVVFSLFIEKQASNSSSAAEGTNQEG